MGQFFVEPFIMLRSSLMGDAASPLNRRRFVRTRPRGDGVVSLYTSQSRWPGIIVDQSTGGFGLAVPSTVSVDVGDAVRVTTRHLVIKAAVVSREERPGGVRLGLKVQKKS